MRGRLTPTDRAYIAMKLNKIHFNSRKHNGYHVVYRSRTSKNARGATTLCFGIARVLTHELVAQFNGCASSTSQAYARRPLCADDGLTSMPGTRLYVGCQISLSQCRKKISILLGDPFHSGAPRLCLPCLPSRYAAEYN